MADVVEAMSSHRPYKPALGIVVALDEISHERWDGKGYPQGLKEEEIPLLSRIIAVVDSYDAMTEDRVYRKAMTHEQALDEISKNAGTQFDPYIAGLFISHMLE